MVEQLASNVPKLRFLGCVGNWDLRTIRELVDDGIIHPPQDGNHGEIHPKKSDFVERGIPFVMANNIRNGELDLRNCSHISFEQAETLRKGFAVTGDVLLTHKGTVGETAIVGAHEFPFIMLTPQVTFYRILESDKLDSHFLAVSFGTNRFQAALEEAAGGGTRAYIGILQQQDLRITIPLKGVEQKKIGSYFKSLDRMIELHQRKHDKLVILKQAMLQKMFPQDGASTPEIRFKGFQGGWERATLGSICEIVGGGTPSTSIAEYWDGQIDWYSPTEVGSEVYAGSSVKRITQIGLEKCSATMLPAGRTVLFTSRAGIGHMAILTNAACTNQGFQSFVLNDGTDPYCIYSMGDLIKKFALKHASGSTFLEISGKQLEKMELRLPGEAEQQKLGTYFRSLDKLISKHATQLKKLKNIKSACLDKMFI